jgi:hypothetical protein
LRGALCVRDRDHDVGGPVQHDDPARDRRDVERGPARSVGDAVVGVALLTVDEHDRHLRAHCCEPLGIVKQCAVGGRERRPGLDEPFTMQAVGVDRGRDRGVAVGRVPQRVRVRRAHGRSACVVAHVGHCAARDDAAHALRRERRDRERIRAAR